jgi:acyl carrier protein
MEKSDITNIVIEVLGEYLETQGEKKIITMDTQLFGSESLLDSMGLVNVVIDLESRFLDENLSISLTSEKAMSRKRSPFKSVSVLSDYIFAQASEVK